MRQIICDGEVNNISELIKNKSYKDVGEIYGVSDAVIRYYINKYNIEKIGRFRLNTSKLKFNLNYFDIIDTERKAYWLGYIAADGCLKNNKVTITSKDKEILDKFKTDTCSEHKISCVLSYDKRTKKYYQSYKMSITNNIFCKKVQEYISIDKSNSFSLPKIDNKYYSFFIAGMFDGDGCISFNRNRIKCSLISTEECLKDIQNILLLNLGIDKTTLYKYKKNKNVWKMNLYSGALAFLNYIYKTEYSELYLQRKFKKYYNYIYG